MSKKSSLTKTNKELAKKLAESLVGKLMEVDLDDKLDKRICVITDVTYSGDTADFYLEYYITNLNLNEKISFSYKDLYFLSIGQTVDGGAYIASDYYCLIKE
jgi:hypothetical protein